MSDSHKAYIAMVASSAIVGLSFMFVTIALEVVSPLDLLLYRFVFAVLFGSVPVIIGVVRVRMTMKAVIDMLPLATLYPLLFFTFQTFGLQWGTSSEAGIILATVPIFTALWSWLYLKESLTKLQLAGIMMSLAGVLWILINQTNHVTFSVLGISLLLGSTLSISWYNVLARKLSARYSFYTMVYIMSWFGLLVFAVMSVVSRVIRGQSLDYLTPLLNKQLLLAMLYLGGLSSFVTAALNNYALSKISAAKMSVFSHLSTIITIAAGIIILGEHLYTYHIIGAAFILLGIIGVNYHRKD